MEWLEVLDRDLLLLLNGWHAPWLDPVMWFFTEPIGSLPWFAVIVLLVYKKYGWQTALAFAGGTSVVVLFCDRVSVELFKEVFQRYRPSRNVEIGDLLHLHIDENGNVYKGGWYGFVSSHATNFFGMAMYFWLWLRPAKRWVVLMLFGWAAFVSYTRIYLGVHYPGDIVAGSLLGLGLGWLAHWIVRWVLRRLSTKDVGKSWPESWT